MARFAVALVAALLVLHSTHAANLITTGGFEGQCGGNICTMTSLGPLGSTGWVLESGTVEYIGAAFWPPSSGAHSLDMNGNNPARLSQTVTATSGVEHIMQYCLLGNSGSAPAVKTMDVTLEVNGSPASSQSVTFDTSTLPAPYDDYRLSTIAPVNAGDSIKVTFDSTTPGLSGPVIDDVIIAPASEFAASCFGLDTAACEAAVNCEVAGGSCRSVCLYGSFSEPEPEPEPEPAACDTDPSLVGTVECPFRGSCAFCWEDWQCATRMCGPDHRCAPFPGESCGCPDNFGHDWDGSCRTSCTYCRHCAPGYYCTNGGCEPRRAECEGCVIDTQCESDVCLFGFCTDPASPLDVPPCAP